MNQRFKTNFNWYSITERIIFTKQGGAMHYFHSDSTHWTDLEPGIRRKIVGHTPQLMSVLVQFDKGAVGTAHAHDLHDQIAFVVAGSFEVTVNGETRILRAGDAFIAVHHQTHGAIALEHHSLLLDQFSPRRDDFLPVGGVVGAQDPG
jgi:quercetin dioxygenase-like cupin family protein